MFLICLFVCWCFGSVLCPYFGLRLICNPAQQSLNLLGMFVRGFQGFQRQSDSSGKTPLGPRLNRPPNSREIKRQEGGRRYCADVWSLVVGLGFFACRASGLDGRNVPTNVTEKTDENPGEVQGSILLSNRMYQVRGVFFTESGVRAVGDLGVD